MIKFLTFCLFVLVLSNSCGQTNKLNNKEIDWTQDLDLYKRNLEQNHIDLYNTIDSVEFGKELQKITSALPDKSDTEIIVDLMQLTRKIGDGHTAVSLRGVEPHLFPIEIYKMNRKWRVIKTSNEYSNLLGKILTEIDGKPISIIEEEVSKVAQYVENEQSEVYRTGRYLVISEVLFGLQLTNTKLKAKFTFLDDTGTKSTLSLDASDSEEYYENTDFQTLKVATPQIQKPIDSGYDFLWFSPIQNINGIYIKFESYPSFEGMEEFGESVLDYVNENQIEQVVIDLRNNGGGDFFVGTFLAYYLNLADSIDFKSGVYLLTDRVTFSAGTSNASQFRQILNAKIVGEPTGSNPTGYQDMGQFTLPNSKLIITYSKRLFRFQDNVTAGVQPDVLIEYNWENYSNGVDNMLEWIIKDIKQK
ncbi:S41 family peptidase [Flagellimonas meridianipacifica]|uniref:Peptidase S41-like protein n=1 Tax=Flagellimonas meridianipacifica TaxID=1080225 RepID=A0A2T0MIT6_9FLAO|nr:S41 family peptidase [Allomuricauda pacifica]PRX57494.1 peptidase S41-like protein [Allomuricauda pacifica]